MLGKNISLTFKKKCCLIIKCLLNVLSLKFCKLFFMFGQLDTVSFDTMFGYFTVIFPKVFFQHLLEINIEFIKHFLQLYYLI